MQKTFPYRERAIMILKKYALVFCIYSYSVQTSEHPSLSPDIFTNIILPSYIANWSPIKCSAYAMLKMCLQTCLYVPDHAITILHALARNNLLIRNDITYLETLILSFFHRNEGRQLHALFLQEQQTLLKELHHEKYAELRTAVEENDTMRIHCYIRTYLLNPSKVISYSNSSTTLKTLLELGADINTINRGRNILLNTITNNNYDFIQEIIHSGIHINFCTEQGIDALTLCCMRKNSDLEDLILQQQPLKRADHLCRCIQHNNLALANKLLDQGWNPNEFNKDGETPLTLAIKRNKIDFVKLLLQKGADCRLANKMKEAPLTIAENKHYVQIESILK